MVLRIFPLLFVFYSCSSAPLNGKVISIADGDTFTLLVDGNKQIKIRLHGIDCPEKDQDFGKVAKQFISDLIFGKTVSVTEMDVDRYGRTIGIVRMGELNINEELLKAGLAWHYIKYDSNKDWENLERIAKDKKIGLWIMPNAIAPWNWRKLKSKK